MTPKQHRITALRALAASAGIVAGAYATWVGIGWWQYGHTRTGNDDERDQLLDRFVARYDVVERHHIRVAAPAAITFAVAREQELLEAPLVRAIVKLREVVLGAAPAARSRPRGFLAAAQALGWGVLAELPEREIVMGAVTKPWEPNVTFHALPPDEFAAFSEPGFVKIAWTLRADPLTDTASVFRTETRAVATDPGARRLFPAVLGIRVAGHCDHSMAVVATVEADCGAASRNGCADPLAPLAGAKLEVHTCGSGPAVFKS